MLAENTVIGQVFTNFWAIVSTVVAFYFAARVVDTKTLSKDTSEVDDDASSCQIWDQVQILHKLTPNKIFYQL